MKALQIKGYGNIESNLAFNDIDIPSITEHQVLVEIFAASVNPIDYKLVEGLLRRIIHLTFPTGFGYDLAGIVREKGGNVKNFKIGDEVYSSVPQKSRGAFAEFIAVDESMICSKPENLSFQEAASLPLVGLTTIQAFEKGDLKTGDKILIHAGSGGIGSFAIQYAKSKGFYVYATTSSENAVWVQALGADRVIDYKTENYLDIVKDIDFVYDTLGEQFTVDAFKVIKKGGKVISLIGPVDDENAQEMGLGIIARTYLYFKRLSISREIKNKRAYYKLITMKPDKMQLEIIKKLAEAGTVKPIIDEVFYFSDAIKALLYQKEGHAKGKIILKMK